MADDGKIIGVASEVNEAMAENFYDPDQGENNKILELSRKIEALEREKLGLVYENEENKERIKILTIENEGLMTGEAEMTQKLGAMERELERSEKEKKALEPGVTLAVKLETEVSRLQDDLIQAMSEGHELNLDAFDLKRALEEKGARIEGLESEIEELKTAKTECEIRVRDLERKIGVLEVRETEGKSEKVRFEGQMRGKIEEKERQISGFKKRVKDMEALIVINEAELKKRMMEKLGVEKALRALKEEGRLMESKMVHLQTQIEEAEKVINGFKKKTIEAVNETVNGIRVDFGGEQNVLKTHWPAVAVGFTATIAAAAVIYVYSKRR